MKDKDFSHMKHEKMDGVYVVTRIMFALYILVMLFLFILSCSGKRMPDHMFGYLKQDNNGIQACRFDKQGGVICESDLDYYERQDKKVYFFPSNKDN